MTETNIDNLNFKVILDDEKFDEKINRDIELAKQLNVQLSALLNVKSKVATSKMVGDATKAAKFQKATADAAAAQERLKTASTNTAAAQERLAAATANAANAQERLKQSQMRTEQLAKRITAQTERQNKAYAQQSRILNELKGLALGYLSIHGAGQLLSSLVRVTGEFELQNTTLAAMLGDLNAAEGVITRIQGLAVESPFQFKELTTYAKQLSAFSVPAQELYDTTKMLADISAGLGVGMDRIVLAYGQVRSAAFLRGQEVRQFTEAGIPVLDELAKQFTELEGRAVSTSEVFDKISKRLVPFEMVAKVFKDMTSEGGKFYNMQEVQAETLRGKISNLKDAYEVMLNEIGKGQSENLKGAVDWARRLVQNYEETGKLLVELVVAYGYYKTALLGITLLTGTFSLANHKLLSSLVRVGKVIGSNPYALIAAGITAIGYAAYKSKTRLEPYQEVLKSITETKNDFNNAVVSETSKLNTLYARLKLAKEGTDAYNDAKKDIYTKYASYISALQKEGVAVNDLATIYDNLKSKIAEAQKERFRSVASQGLEETYTSETDKILDEANNATERLLKKTAFKFNELEKQAIQAYVGGVLSKEDLRADSEIKKIASILDNAANSGNKQWMQFANSIEIAREQFEKSTKVYVNGLKAIDAIYGKAQGAASDGLNPFVYNLSEDPKGKSPAQKAIEEQIKSVQKLQDAYEKLMPYLNEVQMKSTLKSLFPNIEAGVIDSLDFDAELERLADQLEKFDKDAAQRLRDTIGKDVAGTIAESFRAVEQYKNMMDSWLGEDFNLSGEGVAFDISKIISNLNSEYAKIDQKRAKALDMLNKAQMGDEVALAKVREVLGEEVWQKYLENGKEVIDDLTAKEKNAVRQTAQERLNDLAKKYVDEQTDSLNLSDWGDKSIAQIEAIRQKLIDLKNEEIELPQSTVDALATLDLSVDDLITKIRELFGEQLDNASIEKFKALSDIIGEVTSMASSLGDQLVELGETMGDDFLKGFGKSLKYFDELTEILTECDSLMQAFSSSSNKAAEEVEEIAEEVSKAAEEEEGAAEGMKDIAKSSDWVTMVIKLVVSLINKITEGINSSQKAIQEARLAAIEYANALNQIEFDNLMMSFESAFGTDAYNKALTAMQKAKEYQDAILESQKQIGVTSQELVDFQMDSSGWATFSKGLHNAWKDIKDLGKGDILVDMRSGWQKFWGTGNDLIKTFSLSDFIDEEGMLKGDELREFYETYGEDISNANAAAIEEILGQYDLYVDAVEEVTSYMSDMFGNVADSMADSFIDAFKKSGQAALDYGAIMDDVATNIARSVIKSMLLQSVFTDQMEKDAAEKLASGDTAGAMAVVEQAMQAAQDLSPYIQSFLEQMQPYLQIEADAGTTDLGQGIKGITEDQANLLASYLNAIRADVSYSKTLWVRMDANLQRIADMFTSSPTLMEYQAQIAANTYNTATATQAILDRLIDVIGIGDNGSAIKVVS